MKIEQLIDRLGGALIHGDGNTEVLGIADASSARGLDLVFAENADAYQKALSGVASALVVFAAAAPEAPESAPVITKAVVAHPQPRLWFARAARLLAEPLHVSGVHPSAVVSKMAVLAQGTSVGAGAVLEHNVTVGAWSRIEAGAVIGDHVTIGEHCRIFPRVVIYPGTQIGDRVIVHAGAVLGADGFGYVRDKETGHYTQFPQQGRLVIEDDVEIGANTTIDRGALNETRIRRGAKLDNLVHIGHNCDIGEDVVIASQTGISGSSTVGKGAILAGQVGIGDHAHVGDGVILGGQAGVLSGKTLQTTGTVLWGTPAKPLKDSLREMATLSRLARRKRRDLES
jgi:UDP-3-O-[3-hydroxymyristoyl] glucosamine N-acyltransferase